jgi:GNAT superfamily N-acetyltransferase
MNRKFVIRKSTRNDFEDILRLSKIFIKCEKIFDPTINDHWFDDNKEDGSNCGQESIIKAIENPNEICYVAILENIIVGYIVGCYSTHHSYRTSHKCTRIDGMFVLRRARGLGIGKALISQFVRWSKERKANKITLNVSSGNLLAIHVCELMKFKDYDHVMELDL